ncbi:MAG TPA: nicotinate phosphoribosyltransferase, partial [Candidatus Limnocylindria bacterium]|nr:nicotinate phosphoribosyltransferase [Candidatus Limnocylindria bacterium]
MTDTRPARPRFQPAADVLSGDTADVYFDRAQRILAAEQLDPVVTMEIFPREDAILCGAEEALAYLREIFAEANGDTEPVVESLHDGDRFSPKEVVMRIQARYSAFGLYETAILGILSQSTGWATAA